LEVGALLLATALVLLSRPAQAQSRGDDLARWLDRRGEEIWGRPPEPCDDLTFARRVYLDVLGRIPSVSELRDYQNLGADRREILVEQLVFAEGPRADTYRRLSAAHFARQWAQVLLPPGTATNGPPDTLTQFLAEQYRNHVPYNELISEFVTIQTPQAAGNYYQLSGALPQNYAGHLSRVALGVRIECAQCHDHPFNDWTQRDFWGLAAFYADLSPGSQSAKPGTIEYEGTVYPAKVLLSADPAGAQSVALRSRLARWLTSDDNPYFSATAVNRFWQQFVGRGLYANVENLDLASAEERAFLDEFGQRFAEDGYDVRRLTAAICKSSWYRAESVAESDASSEGFSRTLKTISPNQVFDSLEQSLLLPVSRIDPQSVRWTGGRTQLVNRLSETIGETPEDYTSGIPQALLLMNGKITSDAINFERSRLLRAVVESPFFDQQERIETLYLAVLSRKPTSRELTALKGYLQSMSTDDARKKAFGEILWALLNSPEFVLCR
jgi:hypothetical protein